jgi:hypothetical protein
VALRAEILAGGRAVVFSGYVILLFDPSYERIEHIALAETLSPIEAERVLVQVHLQIFGADIVIHATNPVLG